MDVLGECVRLREGLLEHEGRAIGRGAGGGSGGGVWGREVDGGAEKVARAGDCVVDLAGEAVEGFGFAESGDAEEEGDGCESEGGDGERETCPKGRVEEAIDEEGGGEREKADGEGEGEV